LNEACSAEAATVAAVIGRLLMGSGASNRKRVGPARPSKVWEDIANGAMAATIHPSGIPDKIVNKVVARRGRLHAFETVDAARTALVVIDLDEATVGRDDAATAQRVIANVNALAGALRRRGGVVAWVLSRSDRMSPHFAAILGDDLAATYIADGRPDGPGSRVGPGLDVQSGDVLTTKSGASAFFPGKCDLHDRLKPRGVDTLLVTGAVTNICCESSARDATELHYRVIMISDALSGHAHGLHEATLATFYRIFGDVRPTSEVVQLLGG
jgi:nicotinamidase-related amidase